MIKGARGRWTYEKLRELVLAYRRVHGEELMFLIEATGMGIALLRYMKDAGIDCFSYQPKMDKVARAAWTMPVFETGRVRVLNQAGNNGWVEGWVNEFVNFPFGAFDDQVDSMVQLIHAELRLANAGGGL